MAWSSSSEQGASENLQQVQPSTINSACVLCAMLSHLSSAVARSTRSEDAKPGHTALGRHAQVSTASVIRVRGKTVIIAAKVSNFAKAMLID